ncbi:TPA: RHS domain-containing protein, partial [Stenotrophomonas maltophilia]|nr:RHS domain-containing protein [Stenotrophomonas maltophilia]
YQYDARGNMTQRWHNGKESRYTWDLFDRLTHYEDERLAVDYTYDALGRRLSKHSQAHYEERREAGPLWNRAERVKRNRELLCGFTLFGWDGDNLAWESKIADEDGLGARTTHYVYEPGSFVPVAQAVREEAIALLDQPEYGDYYRQDEDPLWFPPPPAPTIDSLAWYQTDHLGTPQELTDERGDIAWAAEYRAWGVVKEALRKASGKAPIVNPIRFQGQYHDHETGLHYNRYRYYDPEVGRFVSKDPTGFTGGLNIFQYVPNPATWVDPLGLAKQCAKCLPNCNDHTIQGPKDATQMAQELSQQINKNSASFSTPATQGHIDLQGATHFDKATGTDIPTPHVQSRTVNVGPNGQVTTSKKTEVTTATTKQDVRVARELARRRGLCK